MSTLLSAHAFLGLLFILLFKYFLMSFFFFLFIFVGLWFLFLFSHLLF